MVQGLNVSNAQPSINPINTHVTCQQQQVEQKQPQVVQGYTIPNMHSNVNPLDLHAMYQQQCQHQQALFSKQ